jgi:uncharacterized protein YidB (DUF937 family)
MDQLMKLLSSLFGSGQGSQVLQMLPGLLASSGALGGLGGLLKQLDAKGLGDVGRSWVSTGPNTPISAEQLKGALTEEQLSQVASSMGVSPDKAAKSLAKVLPDAVDKLTPDGAVPADADADAALESMGKLLGKR